MDNNMPPGRKKIIIANWKMNLNLKQSADLAEKTEQDLKKIKEAEIVVCPPFTVLASIQPLLENIKLGAQNVFWHKKGAYTGEISPTMLKELGCEYVIIGHSERRQYLLENDELVQRKVAAVVAEKITPIICVGENFTERQNGQKDYIVTKQVLEALKDLKIAGTQQIIIAYEPVWVIGSGQAVDPEEIENIHRVIKHILRDLYPVDIIKKNFRIIYGGSVHTGNIKDFASQEAIDGFLIGSASLKAGEFVKIVKSAI